MSAKERLSRYLDIELPEEQLLFHVAMVLNSCGCFVVMMFTLLLRMNGIVPAMLFVGVLLTLAAMYAESMIEQLNLVSVLYLITMFSILLPLMSNYVPYAIYDFQIYFLAGIFYIAFLFKIRWAVIFISVNSAIDLFCMHKMILMISDPEVSQTVSAQNGIVLFCRIIVALFITGTICGVLIFFRGRILRREIKKSVDMEHQAEQLSYAKDMFLVNVSHEIRTPLNAILGVTELLLDQDADECVKDSAFHMANSSRALLSITNELMDFSKLDDTKPVIANKPYYIGDIFNELINMLSVRFADYNTELFTEIAPDIPEQLVGDAVLVRQLMLSVLAEIIKSIQTGKVYLQIGKEDDTDNRIRLFIEIHVEGAFRHSYQDLLQQGDAGEFEEDERAVPLPYRLVSFLGGEVHMEENNDKRTYSFNIRQGYIPGKTLVDGTAARQADVLFYENTALQGNMFAKVLKDMNVAFCQALDDDLFLKECVNPHYTHIMIAAGRYEGIKDKLKEILPPQSVILIGSHMISFDDAHIKTTFSRPVNCLNLDALLCGRQSSMIRHIEYKGGFICPEAHIMVVDDNIVNLEVATSMLNRYQAKVSVAASGKECLKLLKEESVDFILLDYMMPEMDGIDTLKNIRSMGDPKLETVPIVALTANAVSGAREMFLEAGFDEYISKPIERDKFEKVLRICLPEELIIYTMDKQDQAVQTA